MKWEQRFEIALKTGTFTYEDVAMARSWPDCAAGDKLRSMGYNKSYTADELGDIIEYLDKYLANMGIRFASTVMVSASMPKDRVCYSSEDKYRKKCIRLVNRAQKIYDKIQSATPDTNLADYLELKATPAAA